MRGDVVVGDFGDEVSDNRRFCVVGRIMLFSGLGELGDGRGVMGSSLSFICVESLISVFWSGSVVMYSLDWK